MKVYQVNIKKWFNTLFWVGLLVVAILFGFKIAFTILGWILLLLFIIIPLLLFLVLVIVEHYFKRKLKSRFAFSYQVAEKKKNDEDAIDVHAKVVK